MSIFSDEKNGHKIYQLLYQSTSDAIVTLEPPDWKFTSGNPAALKLFGFNNDKEFIKVGPSDLAPKTQPDGVDSVKKAKKMILKALGTGFSSFEWVHQRKNGESFPSVVLLSKIEIDGKQILQATISDISDRRKLENALSKERQQWQTILDSIPAWIFYKDTKNRFLRVNKVFSDIMGTTVEKLEGKSLFDLFPKEQAENFMKDDKEVIQSGNPKKNIIESMKSPRGALWVQTDKIPYRDENGKIIGIIGFTLDITKRKEIEENLKKKNEETENINKLMVGRELKMIELKKEILELKNGSNAFSNVVKNKFQSGIDLEEDIIQALETDYETMVKNSELDHACKNKIVNKLQILLEDSKKHEKYLKGLE